MAIIRNGQKNGQKRTQHAPTGRRPLQTHLTVEEEEEREKKRYVVRDRDWSRVWAENVTWERAHKISQVAAGRRKSDTVRVEEMPTEPELLALCTTADIHGEPLPPDAAGPTPEQLAKLAADAAAAESQRRLKAAQAAAREAQARAAAAQAAAVAAQKAAEAQMAAAQASPTVDQGELGDDPAGGEVDPDKLAEADLLEDAALEDITEGGSPIVFDPSLS